MTKIKFCGLRTLRDIGYANALGPEYAGFVLAPRFWRCISRETAAELKKALLPEIKAVGVFVDNPYDEVKDYLESGIIDIAQLHGTEDCGFITRLREETGKPVIKAFKIASESDVELAARSPADFVLLDAGTGSGIGFDWSLISGLGRDYFLAGGLNPENVSEAVKKLHPYAVDVSSGTETDKIKDFAKMKAFAEAVRNTK